MLLLQAHKLKFRGVSGTPGQQTDLGTKLLGIKLLGIKLLGIKLLGIKLLGIKLLGIKLAF